MSVPYSDVVVVGGSTAGLRAAEAVVRQAPELSVTVISNEPYLPYELPPLSKTGLAESLDIDALIYPIAKSIQGGDVDFRLGTSAESLDRENRVIRLSSGEELGYRAMVIATGCEPFVPPLFAGRENVFTLRRFDDAVGLRAALAAEPRSVAVVGAGFIGGEFASTLVKAGREVSLIDMAPHPLGAFGASIATAYAQLHQEAGVGMHFGAAAVGIAEDDDGRVLVLDNGRRVPADVIVVGVGVRPAVDWLETAGLPYDNGIVADGTLRVADGIFAAGDVVRWPNPRFDAVMRIEHWTSAAEQGRAAGINAAHYLQNTEPVPVAVVPYFWSDQHGTRIQFAGYLHGDETLVESSTPEGLLFLYRRGDTVTAVMAFERRAQFVKLRALLRRGLSWEQASESVFSDQAVVAGG